MRDQVLTAPDTTAISASPARPGFWRSRDGQMTGTTRSSNGLDDRRKRLLFRCWHRGTREMDLILGRFADAEIGILADLELTQLEALIGLEDPDLYPAFVGEVELPPEFHTPLFERIKSFRNLDKPA
jgi:antitoxin CptB